MSKIREIFRTKNTIIEETPLRWLDKGVFAINTRTGEHVVFRYPNVDPKFELVDESSVEILKLSAIKKAIDRCIIWEAGNDD